MKTKQYTLKKFISLLDKLSDENKSHVLDLAVFLVWRSVGRPAPFWTIVRGGIEHYLLKAKRLWKVY